MSFIPEWCPVQNVRPPPCAMQAQPSLQAPAKTRRFPQEETPGWQLTSNPTSSRSWEPRAAPRMPILKLFGLNWKPQSCSPLKKIKGSPQRKTKTGLTKMTKKSSNCCWRRELPTNLILLSHPSPWRKLSFASHAASSSASCELSRMSAGPTWSLKLSFTPTVVITGVSTKP